MAPVIDIHAHIFRGKDIPLKGYLLARAYPEWYIWLLGPVLFTILEKAIRGEWKGPVSRLVMEATFGYLGSGYRTWAEILSLGEVAEIADRMIKTFQKDRINLFVPLMIDFEYWFKPTPQPSMAAQIDLVYRDIVLRRKGRVHPFVPFDPARELAYRAKLPGPNSPVDGPAEKYGSLELVKDAIRNKGFLGVKIYNTLGYRPLGNAAVDEKRRGIFLRNGMRRYAAFTGEQFDQVLTELYEYCVREQVPVTAHCVSNGIEAYPGASFDFARPEYWRPVLDRYPDLHLNLAHFGWNDPEGYLPKERFALAARSWRRFQKVIGRSPVEAPRPESSRAKEPKTWVGEICEMLAQYKYLYADVSHHGVTEEKDLPKFRASYKAMIADYPGLIQKKLLFGIDWHVIARMPDYVRFKERYLQVLEEDGLFSDPEIGSFLGGNGLHFLGLLPLGTKSGDGWNRNRKRLNAFYRKNRIRPPAWFRSTEESKPA